MPRFDRMRIAVIGAGPSGLAAAKNLLQAGFRNITVLEKGSRVGGNWAQSGTGMYESVHAISSKTLSQYEDFPFPGDYPDYPSRVQLARYFEAYARRFGLLPFVRFGCEVQAVQKLGERRWAVKAKGDDGAEYQAVFVCNGHHATPRWPGIPGTFAGQMLHSKDFQSAHPFARSRVLIIGGGNSGCDIAVQVALAAKECTLSLRRGYYILPRYLLGKPSDVLHARLSWLPRRVIRSLGSMAIWAATSLYTRNALPVPDHALFAAHPVINSEFLPLVRRRRITVVPPVTGFQGNTATFADGVERTFDAVICCTGYQATFPFLARELIDFGDAAPPLYLRMFHPEHRELFFIGLVQPNGCIWPLSDLQAKLAASYLAGRYQLPTAMPTLVAREVKEISSAYVASPRHSVEVDYHEFRRRLLREIPRAAPAWRDALAGSAPQ